MIESWAEKIAVSIKKSNEAETASVDVMKFALIGILDLGIAGALTLLIGFATGALYGTLLSLASFFVLRLFSGGYHFKTAEACILFSTAALAAVPHIPVNSLWTVILTSVSCILVLLYAPSNIKGATRIPEKYHFYLKPISLVLVASNFLIVSGTLSLAFTLQSLSLIRTKKEV